MVHPNCCLFLEIRCLEINILLVSKLWQPIWDKDYNCIVIIIWDVMNIEKKIKSYKYLVIVLLFLSFKFFFISTPNASKAIKIVQLGFEMSKICFFEMKGVIVWFRLIKKNCDLKLKFFDHCSIFLGFKLFFVGLHLMHSKPQKSLKLVLKWTRYILLKWKGSLFDLS